MAGLAVASCSTLAGDNWNQRDIFYDWNKAPSREARPHKYVVDAGVWNTLCEKPSDACAWFPEGDKWCYIISPKPITNAYLDWHERKHCAGYDHKPMEWALK